MRFHALATDYDGTIALRGFVEPRVMDALSRLKSSGRKLLLVTGRELGDLKRIFPGYALFDYIVAENGAHLFRPSTLEERTLGEAPPEELMAALAGRGVAATRGKVIVATHEPYQDIVLDTIRDLGLEHQVIFNKGAVMVLPPGINKARGLLEALNDLSLSPRNVVAVGDAENDHALLDSCECGVAVADALPSLRRHAAWVTPGGAGEGAAELAERLIEDDLRGLDLLPRRGIPLGYRQDGSGVRVDPYARGILLAGTTGGGKTTIATAFLESLSAGGYQHCVIDPEGDYGTLEHAAVLGDARHAPFAEEAARILEQPDESVVLCTLAVAFQDRPEFFQALLPDLLELRARTGRPHWIVVDEAHHLLPSARSSALLNLPKDPRGFFLITLEPKHVDRSLLGHMDWILAVGENPGRTLADFASAVGRQAPGVAPGPMRRGEAIAWRLDGGDPPFLLRSITPKAERRRHVRKYSAGELGPDKSFRFRGPDGKLNLRAQNLMIFMQIAEGVDDATWNHHLRQRDYSRWFQESIKDEGLADEARAVEERADFTPVESRRAMREVIERRYTGPA
jgi:HAD superfamily hydrolase (TIGR01484 family)